MMEKEHQLPPHKISFSHLLDRGLSSPATLAQWCPTMDLLALLTADGQLQLYRLNWQRLWSLTPEYPITCLAWRPDGKQIAIGQQNGQLLLLSTENGETLHQASIFTSPVVSLSWTHSSSTTTTTTTTTARMMTAAGDRAPRFFEPPLPPLTSRPEGPILANFENYNERIGKREDMVWGDKGEPKGGGGLGVVAAADAQGHLALCSGEGLYLFAKIPCIRAERGRICSLSMPSTMTEVSVVWVDVDVEEEAGRAKEEEVNSSYTYNLTVIDTSEVLAIAGAQRTLLTLSSLSSDIMTSLKTCTVVAGLLCEEWAAAASQVQTFKDTLDQLLQKNGIESHAQADLLLLVTMGEYTGAMEQFLMSSLGEGGIKKIARAVDSALSHAHALLVDRMQPEMELLAFRLGEVRGLGASPFNRLLLGLRAAEVGAAERAALDVLGTLDHVRDRLTFAAAQYRTFFSWLTTALRRFPEDTVDTMMGYPLSHVDSVRSFLHTEFHESCIYPLLTNISGGEGNSISGAVDRVALGSFDPEEYETYENSSTGSTTEQYDHWKDEIKEDQEFAAAIGLFLAQQFEKEKSLDQDGVDEIEEAKLQAQAIRATGNAGVVQRLEDLVAFVIPALRRPAVSMSRLLRSRNTVEWLEEHATLRIGRRYCSSNSNSSGSSTDLAIPCTAAVATHYQSSTTTANATTTTMQQQHFCMTIPMRMDDTTNPTTSLVCVQRQIIPPPLPACRLYLHLPTSGIAGHDMRSKSIDVSMVAIPPEYRVIDIGAYKNGALAVLFETTTTPGGGGGGGGGEQGVLSVIPQDVFLESDVCARVYKRLVLSDGDRDGDVNAPPGVGSLQDRLRILTGGTQTDSCLPLALDPFGGGCQVRSIPYPHCCAPLAVSATRGIGFVLAGNKKRAVLYDMEEDGDEEEEMEEE